MNESLSESEPSSEPSARPKRSDGDRRVQVPVRTAINYWLDLLLAATFVIFVWLAAVIRFVFPTGPRAHIHRLWNRTIDEWRALEFGVLCGFAILVVIHVTLHWNWVCSVTNTLVRHRPPGRDNGSRTLLGVAILIGILHVLAAGLLYARYSLQALPQ